MKNNCGLCLSCGESSDSVICGLCREIRDNVKKEWNNMFSCEDITPSFPTIERQRCNGRYPYHHGADESCSLCERPNEDIGAELDNSE